MSAQGAWKCPNCGANNSKRVIRCRKCNTEKAPVSEADAKLSTFKQGVLGCLFVIAAFMLLVTMYGLVIRFLYNPPELLGSFYRLLLFLTFGCGVWILNKYVRNEPKQFWLGLFLFAIGWLGTAAILSLFFAFVLGL